MPRKKKKKLTAQDISNQALARLGEPMTANEVQQRLDEVSTRLRPPMIDINEAALQNSAAMEARMREEQQRQQHQLDAYHYATRGRDRALGGRQRVSVERRPVAPHMEEITVRTGDMAVQLHQDARAYEGAPPQELERGIARQAAGQMAELLEREIFEALIRQPADGRDRAAMHDRMFHAMDWARGEWVAGAERNQNQTSVLNL